MIQNSGSLKIHQNSNEQPVNENLLNNLIVDSIQDIKGNEIVIMNLKQLEDAPTDFFIICQGNSHLQVKAIAENVQKRVKEELNLLPSHTEGLQDGRWVLVDYFNIIVHVFYPETRSFYELETLWNDADIEAVADNPAIEPSSS